MLKPTKFRKKYYNSETHVLHVYPKRIKFNTGFILERSNLVVLILVP